MRTVNVVMAGVCALMMAACGAAESDLDAEDLLDYNAADALAEQSEGKADALWTTSTYYTIRHDFRRCISPLCGGYFMKRVNRQSTLCADGTYQDECYVAEANFGPEGAPANLDRVIVRGAIKKKIFPGFGNQGRATITESWVAPNDAAPAGPFYRLTDSGIRCITTPCISLHQAKLNSTVSKNFSDLNLSGSGATAEQIDAATNELYTSGILAAGYNKKSKLNASQFYTRYTGEAPAKVCRATGCSGQICADDDRISTCEFRAEYACYRTAACEVQADGECGWTQSAELTACLANPPTL